MSVGKLMLTAALAAASAHAGQRVDWPRSADRRSVVAKLTMALEGQRAADRAYTAVYSYVVETPSTLEVNDDHARLVCTTRGSELRLATMSVGPCHLLVHDGENPKSLATPASPDLTSVAAVLYWSLRRLHERNPSLVDVHENTVEIRDDRTTLTVYSHNVVSEHAEFRATRYFLTVDVR